MKSVSLFFLPFIALCECKVILAAPPQVIYENNQTVMIRDWARLPNQPNSSEIDLKMNYSSEHNTSIGRVDNFSTQTQNDIRPHRTTEHPSLKAQQIASMAVLPYSTSGMVLGKISPTQVDFDLSRPICVLGSDETSLKWVAQHREALIRMNALCWLIEATDLNDLKEVNRVTQGLSVLPLKGDLLVKNFGLTHYPALITRDEIRQ